MANYTFTGELVVGTYYVFIKENYYRPVKIEAASKEDAVDQVADDRGAAMPIEFHSTGHWSEWLVEDEQGVRYQHVIGVGYTRL